MFEIKPELLRSLTELLHLTNQQSSTEAPQSLVTVLNRQIRDIDRQARAHSGRQCNFLQVNTLRS